MTGTRHFLGWDQPALPRAAAWLAQHAARADSPAAQPPHTELHHWRVVVPGARAGRRLMELLTEQPELGGALTPPDVRTLGSLPDLLCPPPTRHRIATDTQAALARMAALRAFDRDTLATVAPHPPAEQDVMGWYRLADRLRQLGDELAAGACTVDDVCRAQQNNTIDLPRPERWEALRDIEHAYHQRLADDGLVDRQRHRLDTMRAGECTSDREIILIATPDLGPLTEAMLRQVAEHVSVIALIHAPDAHADGFDDLGACISTYWRDQVVELPESSLRVVERTTDQPGEVAAAVAAMNEQRQAAGQNKLAPDEVTIGLGDETQGGAIRRTLQRAGAPARTATGRALRWTPPAVLLGALATFAERHRLDAFAELVRHPDVADYLRHHLQRDDAGADWLTLLDDYITRHLRAELADNAFGDDDRYAALKHAYRAVADLLPHDAHQCRALPDWARTISEALGAFYAQRELSRFKRADEAAISALQTIGDVLRDHSQLDTAHHATPTLTLAEAMRLALAEAETRLANVPEPGGDAAIELLGFLELPLDDAPAAIVTSLNEQHLPATPQSDAFLPDHLRAALGVPDASRRYARDKLLLAAATHGRDHVALIAPRRAAEGDPLTPSRLLLACDESTRTHRIRRFYDDEVADAPPARALLTPGGRNQFRIPHPGAAARVPDRLAVTAFRDYLACPYRFYLKHVEHLEAVDDRATELSAGQFGEVAHEVLETFAREGPTEATDPTVINDFLEDALNAHFRQAFGTRLRPALHIQRQQIAERLEVFAHRQAELAQAGWRIHRAEHGIEATITVDGEPFTLKGQIDRIDVHDELGYRVIDYKTSDRPQSPQKTHRGRVTATHRPEPADSESWLDLQLPLYLDLIEIEHGIARDHTELAYFNLPRKLKEVELKPADWDADTLREAGELRDWVIRQVRAARYWPPQPPGTWPDEYTWLCADAVLDRDRLIHESAAVSTDHAAEGGRDA